MSIYKGTQLISGVATPIEAGRNIGQIIPSLLPLTDAGLHLLDGALIDGNGIHKAFVDYIKTLDLTANCFMQPLPEKEWTKPIATSNSMVIDGGTMQISASSIYSTDYQAYRAMDGSTSGNSWSSASGVTTGWWQVKFPYKIKITGLTFYSASNTGYCAKNCRFYTSATKTTPIGDAFVGSSAVLTATGVAGIPAGGIITDTIYLDITSSHTTGIGMGELVITATKAPKTAEERWQESVSKYGVCGKFVYNVSANTVRLPKVTGFVEGTLDANALGDLVEAGLPNITGGFNTGDRRTHITGTSGALYTTTVSSANWAGTSGTSGNTQGVGLDASRSNPIYGNADTVQPQAIKGYMYIVLTTGTKTDIEVDIDNIVTDLNNKVDINSMVEITDIGEPLTGLFMPDYTAGISFALSTNFTAPANGVINVSTNGYAGAEGSWYWTINGGVKHYFGGNNGGVYPITVLVSRDDVFWVNGNSDNENGCWFYPCKGDN